jgi:hypothetical protein
MAAETRERSLSGRLSWTGRFVLTSLLSWAIATALVPLAQAAATGSGVAPNFGTGLSQTFGFQYFDPNGYSSIV